MGTSVSFQFRAEAYRDTSQKQHRRLVSLRLIDANSAGLAKTAT